MKARLRSLIELISTNRQRSVNKSGYGGVGRDVCGGDGGGDGGEGGGEAGIMAWSARPW